MGGRSKLVLPYLGARRATLAGFARFSCFTLQENKIGGGVGGVGVSGK